MYKRQDEGQEEQKTGIWLGDYYIVDADTESPYVWAVDSKGRLEKRSVVLGQHDDDLSEYEIADGLTEDDSIAFPSDSLEEGMRTKDVSEMTDEDLEAVDMESNLDGSEYSDGDTMEPMDGDYSSCLLYTSMAAGLSIEEANVEAFRRQLNENCTLTEEDMIPKIVIDVPMPISYINENLIRQLSVLAVSYTHLDVYKRQQY